MRRILLSLAVGCLLALPATAQTHGPDGFDYPLPGGGRDLAFGAERDDRFWSWFEIGPDVCSGEDARVYLRVGGRRISVACDRFVHARVAPGGHPKNWGRVADPIRAYDVSGILALEPPAMLTLSAEVERTDRRRREVLAILAGACEPLAEGFRACRPDTWKPARRMIVADTAPRLRDGLPLHMICETSGGTDYCLMQDGAPGPGRMLVNVAWPQVDAAALDLMLPLYEAGSEMAAGWAR